VWYKLEESPPLGALEIHHLSKDETRGVKKMGFSRQMQYNARMILPLYASI